MQFAPCKPCPSADGTGEGRPTTGTQICHQADEGHTGEGGGRICTREAVISIRII